MRLNRGEVWDADFDQHPDSRQNGIRPAVVVQTDHLNDKANYPVTILVPWSGSGSEKIPSHACIRPSEANGLDKESYAKCEQIQALPKAHLKRMRGRLSNEDVAQLNAKLKNALGLNDPHTT